jgi:cell division septal protein FtsQ
MSPSRKSTKSKSAAPLARLLTGPARTAALMALLLVGLAVAGRAVWSWLGPQIVASDAYRLDPRNIKITPQPDYIRADVKAEVVRDASLDAGLSMLDERLTERVAEAFAYHPWVASVERVTKAYPGKVTVELTYRRPVVMISLAGSSNLELLPVDAEGYRLPGSDFSSLEKRRFPRLVGIAALPLVGQQSTDPRVRGGARLAALLGEVWHQFNLARIVPVPATQTDAERFELITRTGARVVWGAAPGEEPEGEPKAEEKLARLRRHFKEYGTLDNTRQAALDMRYGASGRY